MSTAFPFTCHLLCYPSKALVFSHTHYTTRKTFLILISNGPSAIPVCEPLVSLSAKILSLFFPLLTARSLASSRLIWYAARLTPSVVKAKIRSLGARRTLQMEVVVEKKKPERHETFLDQSVFQFASACNVLYDSVLPFSLFPATWYCHAATTVKNQALCKLRVKLFHFFFIPRACAPKDEQTLKW